MGASGCLTCCRWCCCCFLSVVNILSTIIGLLFLAIGCVMLWAYGVVRTAVDSHVEKLVYSVENIETSLDVESLHKAMESSTMITAAVFIILGVVLVTVSCLGCCGACFGVPACLIIYAVFIGLILLSQAALVIVWFTSSYKLKDSGRQWLETRIANYKGTQNADIESMQLDTVQIALGCCGLNDGNDFYTMAKSWNRTIGFRNKEGEKFKYYNASYPYSCCNYRLQKPTQDYRCAYANVSEPYGNYKIGCYEKFVESFDNITKPAFDKFFYGVAGSLALELLLLLGVLLIYYHKRQQQEDIPHSGVQYKMQPQMA